MPDATARQQRILAAVQAQGFATIEALADTLGVSAQTARREAIRLQEAGLLQRFHGGVGLPEERVWPGYALKRHAAPEAKRRIGAAVAALVPRGASVFIDVGTTAEAAARALAGHGRLRVVTVSLHVAGLLAGRPGIEVFVAGGTLRGADGSLVGVETCAALARFRCDLALIGCSGFAEDGTVMDHDLDKIAAKQAMLRAARKAVLLADAAKFARTAPALVAPAAAFGRLVTDAAPPAGLAAALAAQGTMTVLA